MDGWKRLKCQRTHKWMELNTWVRRLLTLDVSYIPFHVQIFFTAFLYFRFHNPVRC
jgi:competence transcription factor ComK